MSREDDERISEWSMPAQRAYLLFYLIVVVGPVLFIIWELWELHILGKENEFNGALAGGLLLWILLFSGIQYVFRLKPEEVAGDAYRNWLESQYPYRWYKSRYKNN